MILSLMITIGLGVIVLWFNSTRLRYKWFGIAMFAESASISVYLLNNWAPSLPNLLINSLVLLTDGAVAFSFGMFGIMYSELYSKRQRRLIVGVALAMFGAVWLTTPLSPTRYINYVGYNEVPLVAYLCLMIAAGVISMIIAYHRESLPHKRVERMLTQLLAIPCMLIITLSYVLYMLEVNLFQLNYLLSIPALCAFIILGIRKGILGVKIRIAMYKADTTVEAIEGSTNLISHTIKNEIGKIDIMLHQIRRALEKRTSADPQMHEVLDIMSEADRSVQHMGQMMNQMNEKIKIVEIRLQKSNLQSVIASSIKGFSSSTDEGPEVRTELQPVPHLYIDPLHIREVLMNLLTNASEAMALGGVITLRLQERGKFVVLQVQDQGRGLDATELQHLFDPFYTTKQSRHHYGLGLYYCKNVMIKHGGSIGAEPMPNGGSCFSLYFKK